jgi:hypothetical protein
MFECINPVDNICSQRKCISNTSHCSDSHAEQKPSYRLKFFLCVEDLEFLHINLCFIVFRLGTVKEFIFGIIISEENTLRKKVLWSEGQTQL